MKRTALLRRTPMRRSSTPVGAAARARRQAGGPRAKGRPALSSENYERLRQLLLIRADGRCEACGSRAITGEIEHAVPRSAGGTDSWANCWIPCRNCARAKEAAFAHGRLLVTPVGLGVFKFQRAVGNKWNPVKAEPEPWTGGRAPTYTEAEVLASMGLTSG